MKMRTLRKLKLLPARRVRRYEFDMSDASIEPEPGPAPEAVFDRLTGPWDHRRAVALPGAADEET